jgi:hypothetical protein
MTVFDDGTAAQELYAFLRSHRALAIERRWVEAGLQSADVVVSE